MAVPSLVRAFHAPIATIQWVITGYTLAQAAVIPLAGWLSDRYGAKPLFLTSIALFTIGSALCATAQSTRTPLLELRVFRSLDFDFAILGLVACLSTLLTSRTATHSGQARAALTAHGQHPAAQAVQLALGRATATVFDDTFHVVAVATVFAALLGLLLRRRSSAQRAEQQAAAGAAEGVALHVTARPHGSGRRLAMQAADQ